MRVYLQVLRSTGTPVRNPGIVFNAFRPSYIYMYSGVCVFVPAENARETDGKRTANALKTVAISTNQIAVFENATFSPVLSFPDTRQPMKSAFFCDVCVSLHQPIIFAFCKRSETIAMSTNQIAVFKNATFSPVLSFPDTRQPMKSAFFCDVCVSFHQPIIFAFSEKRIRLRFCVRFRALRSH